MRQISYPIIPFSCMQAYNKLFTKEVEQHTRYGQGFYGYMKAERLVTYRHNKLWWDFLFHADNQSAKKMLLEVTNWEN